MKTTVTAPANIAFIKYWGKKDPGLRIPTNNSISMNLSSAYTTTTVEFSSAYARDEIYYMNNEMDKSEAARIINHLNRIRKLGRSKTKAKIVTQNSFPKGTGIASSASGFAALTMAGVKALGLKLSEKKLSILARTGSGSACRSIPDGFVEWKAGNTDNDSYAYSLYPDNYWDLRDIILITSDEEKKISSSKGHEKAKTSIFFKKRLENLPNRIKKIKTALKDKNFETFGEIVEKEAIELHTIIMTQKPPLFYWNGVTIDIIHEVRKWREEGIPVYFTIDAGPNVHLICEAKNEKKILQKIKETTNVANMIINKPAAGARIIHNHLF